MQLAKPENKELKSKTEADDRFDTRTVVKTLEGLMTKVTAEKVTAETVNAACNCADKIVDFLKVHVEVERMRRRFKE